MSSFFNKIFAGCRNLLQRNHVERELSDELAYVFESLVEAKVREGASALEARRLAAIELGGTEQLKEKVREVRAGYAVEALVRDVRFGARMLLKTPGFTLIALATLALGIGANTAVFSAFNTLLLEPLPFESPDQLVRIYSTKNGAPIQGTGNPGGPSVLDVRDFAERNHTFEKIVAYDTWRKNVSFTNARGEPEQMRVGLVPGDYFEILRTHQIIGRLFSADENQLGRHYVAAINERVWRERFAADPAVLGQKILINDEPYTVVAVMPDVIPEWMEPGRAGKVEIWTPFAPIRAESESSRAARGDAALGRLKRGVSLEQAQADLSEIAAALAATYPVDQDVGVAVVKLADTRAGSLRPMVFLLVGAVGLILLIACLNLANLLLARNAVREQEIAMRAALGAARRSLIRQLLVEAGLLSLSGAAAGLVLAKVAVSMVRSAYAATLPQLATMQLDGRVVTFTLLLCAITTLLFGLIPAVKATQFDLVEVLKQGSRTGTSSLSTKLLRNLLVVIEVAVSLMLVLVASLLIQTIARLERQSLGIRQEHLLKAHFYMPPARYPNPAAITRFCDEFGTRLRALAGVTEASVTTVYPPTNGWIQMLELPQRPVNRVQDVASAQFGVTDSHFLTTLGIPLIRGRNLAEFDTATTQPVALVNEEFVRRYFPIGDAVGQPIHIGPPKFLQIPTGAGTTDDTDVIIVGVIANFRNGGLAGSPQPQIIGLYSQHPVVNYGFKDLVVRTVAEPRVLLRVIADQLHSLDPDMPLAEVQTFDEIVKRQVGDKRFTTFLLSAFASVGLVLAVVGIYGVVSIFVSQRKRELAVRMALGASRGNAVSLVLRQAMLNAAIGTLLGLSGAWAARQLIRGFLFQVSPVDPTTFVCGALFLLAVATVASLIPATRASRIDPAHLLQQE